MTDYKKLIEMLRYCANDDTLCKKEDECPYYDSKKETTHWYYCTEKMMIDAANVIEELYKVAKSMHTYIFLNSVDEQEAYNKCNLTDEMNAILGYGGSCTIAQLKDAMKDKHCKTCKHFIGGGDWDLCCDLPHPDYPCGFLCYEDDEACEQYEEDS